MMNQIAKEFSKVDDIKLTKLDTLNFTSKEFFENSKVGLEIISYQD